eukprot:scaffold260535_cov31-Prasinocladus_malaysianus.AAC.1
MVDTAPPAARAVHSAQEGRQRAPQLVHVRSADTPASAGHPGPAALEPFYVSTADLRDLGHPFPPGNH